jgi:hypothetical protein
MWDQMGGLLYRAEPIQFYLALGLQEAVAEIEFAPTARGMGCTNCQRQPQLQKKLRRLSV